MITIQTGMIVIWADSIASIPTGFALCDGNNETPDLRNRFPIGAGNSYAPDDQGGSPTHNHTFTTDGHTHDEAMGSPYFFTQGVLNSKLSTEQVTGSTDQEISFPPYHSLCYIMFTG